MRLWGKIWKNNHMLRDTVIEDDRDDAHTKSSMHWMRSATNLTLESPYGSIPPSTNLNATAKRVFTRIIS